MKATNYLKLVEEYPKRYESTQFEKVIMASRRAKDLHTGKSVGLVPSEHKVPYLALEEIKNHAVELVYREDEPEAELLADEAEESEEEE